MLHYPASLLVRSAHLVRSKCSVNVDVSKQLRDVSRSNIDTPDPHLKYAES